jgi:hypothetical protein
MAMEIVPEIMRDPTNGLITTSKDIMQMPKFLDAHDLKGTDEETLRNLQKSTCRRIWN